MTQWQQIEQYEQLDYQWLSAGLMIMLARTMLALVWKVASLPVDKYDYVFNMLAVINIRIEHSIRPDVILKRTISNETEPQEYTVRL